MAAVPVLFAKFKEKRIVDDIITAMQNLLLCIELNEILELIKTALKTEKAPVGKLGTMVYLEKAVRTTYIDPLTEMKDDLVKIPISVIEDKDASLRDQGLTVIGVMVARIGEDKMSDYTSKLIPVKQNKIK